MAKFTAVKEALLKTDSISNDKFTNQRNHQDCLTETTRLYYTLSLTRKGKIGKIWLEKIF